MSSQRIEGGVRTCNSTTLALECDPQIACKSEYRTVWNANVEHFFQGAPHDYAYIHCTQLVALWNSSASCVVSSFFFLEGE